MAKQNFLSGGYYGKLGATIGQRWKNIRTVKAYTKPRNPRTPAQQANRRTFASYVPPTQWAKQMNNNSNIFDSQTLTDWNYRIKTTRELINSGMTDLNIIPLYPTTFTPPYLITAMSLKEKIDDYNYIFTIRGNLPPEPRTYAIMLLSDGDEPIEERLTLCTGYTTIENLTEMHLQNPYGTEITDGIQCRIVSTDDKDSTTDMVCSPQIKITTSPVISKMFDTTVTAITRNNGLWQFTLAEPFAEGANTVTGVTAKAVVNGSWDVINFDNVALVNDAGFFAITANYTENDNQKIPALPNGSELYITSIIASGDVYYSHAENITESVESSDLTRSLTVENITVVTTANERYITFDVDNVSDKASGFSAATVRDTRYPVLATFNTNIKTLAENGTIKIYTNPDANDVYCAINGSYFWLDADANFTANGVTYQLKASPYSFTSVHDEDVTVPATGELNISDTSAFFVIVLNSFTNGVELPGLAASLISLTMEFNGDVDNTATSFSLQTPDINELTTETTELYIALTADLESTIQEGTISGSVSIDDTEDYIVSLTSSNYGITWNIKPPIAVEGESA